MMEVNYFNVNLSSQTDIGYLLLQMFFLVIPQSWPSYFTDVAKEEQHVNRAKQVRIVTNSSFVEREGVRRC